MTLRLVVLTLVLAAACDGQDITRVALPDAPQPDPLVSVGAGTVSSSHAQDGHTKVWNKKFTAAHAAYLGAIIYDVEMTHQGLAHHRCVEKNGGDPYPSRGELYGKDLGVLALSTGFDWFVARHKIPFIPYVLPVAGTVQHVRGGTEWVTEGCF